MRGWNIRLEKMFYTTWNILHLKVFTKSSFLFFQKIQKLTSVGDGGGVLIKAVQGGQGKNKRGDVYLGRCSTWSVENQIETRLKALKQWHVSHCGAWSLRFYTNSFKKAT